MPCKRCQLCAAADGLEELPLCCCPDILSRHLLGYMHFAAGINTMDAQRAIVRAEKGGLCSAPQLRAVVTVMQGAMKLRQQVRACVRRSRAEGLQPSPAQTLSIPPMPLGLLKPTPFPEETPTCAGAGARRPHTPSNACLTVLITTHGATTINCAYLPTYPARRTRGRRHGKQQR